MENINDDLGQPFWDAMTNKVEKQEQRIIGLEKKVSFIPDHSKAFQECKTEVLELNTRIARITFPEKEVRELTNILRSSIDQLKQPIVTNVEHHHHFPKIIIITIALIVGLNIAAVGWYFTGRRLNQYIENDTKYRFLKLKKNNSLQQWLFITDSLYKSQPEIRKEVIYQEDSILNRIKRIQEIESRQKQIEELKKEIELLKMQKK